MNEDPQEESVVEEWRGVVGRPGYEISSLGRVRSFIVLGGRFPTVGNTPRLMVPMKTKQGGYLAIYLTYQKKGKKSPRQIHGIMMEAFVGPVPPGMQVAHLDGNPSNNRLTNLAYVTPAENQAHRVLHGTDLRGEDNPSRKLSNESVVDILSLAGTMSAAKCGLRYGVNASTIQKIWDRRAWKHIALQEAKP